MRTHLRTAANLVAAIALFLLPNVAAAATAPIKIVAFGTSLTANGGWQDELARRLGACRDGPVELETVALPGANSQWALETIDEVVAKDPDIVLIEFSMNDASLLHGVSTDQSRTNTEAIILRLQAAIPRVQVVLMTMNPAAGLRAMTRPFLGDFYRIYREIAAEHHVPLADLTTRWEADAQWPEALPDGLHPTPESARAVIVPELLRLLGGEACRQAPS
jgi:lysophospholipase L1-like esterase